MLSVGFARHLCTNGLRTRLKFCLRIPDRQLYHASWNLASHSSLHNVKKYSSSPDHKLLKNTEEYHMIYKFPYIVLARAICRLKIYQTALAVFAVPVVGHLANSGVVTNQHVIATAAISGLAFVMLYVMGEIFRRTVGHIYYNTKEDLVKVSHLTFWGRRQDVLIPAHDIVPITDTSDSPTDIYVRLLTYSRPKSSLFLWLRFGGIINEEKFTEVLGLLRPEDQLEE